MDLEFQWRQRPTSTKSGKLDPLNFVLQECLVISDIVPWGIVSLWINQGGLVELNA